MRVVNARKKNIRRPLICNYGGALTISADLLGGDLFMGLYGGLSTARAVKIDGI